MQTIPNVPSFEVCAHLCNQRWKGCRGFTWIKPGSSSETLNCYLKGLYITEPKKRRRPDSVSGLPCPCGPGYKINVFTTDTHETDKPFPRMRIEQKVGKFDDCTECASLCDFQFDCIGYMCNANFEKPPKKCFTTNLLRTELERQPGREEY